MGHLLQMYTLYDVKINHFSKKLLSVVTQLLHQEIIKNLTEKYWQP